jgi:septal ring factor EnvC (AmiA/AmiB activator)
MKDLLCHRSDIEVKRILEELMASGSIDETKTKREIIMEYQHEKNPEPEFEDIPFVDHNAEALQTTKSVLEAELQTTKEDLQTTRTELAETKTDLEEKTYQIISLEARMAALEQKNIGTN